MPSSDDSRLATGPGQPGGNPAGRISDDPCSDQTLGHTGKDVAVVEEIRILGFAGSLRRASYNRGLIRAAAAHAPTGIIIDIVDL
jgi:hypothetical protein